MKPRRWFAPATMFSHPRLVRHRVSDAAWSLPDLTIAVLSDFHACDPWTPLSALERIAAITMALEPDLIVLGGDFIVDRHMPARAIPAAEVLDALGALRAPLGVVAVMGNHDWRDCELSRATEFRRNTVVEALEAGPFTLLQNRALEIAHGGAWFWLAGLDSQRALKHAERPGFHDPDRAFAAVPDGGPAILVAHEPDYFAEGDSRAFLQISGHTHGGQGNIFGWRPLVPSDNGSRYVWGHMKEGDRHLIVSGGLGYSGLPLRLLQPPEITLVKVTGAD